MFGLGFTEILVILAIALIALGPKHLPEAARTLGKTVGTLRRTLDELKHEINYASLDYPTGVESKKTDSLIAPDNDSKAKEETDKAENNR